MIGNSTTKPQAPKPEDPAPAPRFVLLARVVAVLLVALSLLSGWSLLRESSPPEEPLQELPPSSPTLSDLESSRPAILPACCRVGVIEGVTADRLGLIVNSDMETLLLSVRKPIGAEAGKGDVIEIDGREVARSRFGQATVSGTYRVLKAAPRPSARTEPRSPPSPYGARETDQPPTAGGAAATTRDASAPASAPGAAPKLDQLFGK